MFPELVKERPRGRGLILGLPLRVCPVVDVPSRLCALARERGVLILSAGSGTVRLVPSLTISVEEVNKGCDVIESCMVIIGQEMKAAHAKKA